MINLLFIFSVNASYDEQILKLSELRQNVETLSSQRQSEQKKMNLEIESLTSRKAELEQQLSRERLKNQILLGKKDLNQKLNQVQKQNSKNQQWIEKWIQELYHYVDTGLPYQKEKRLAALDNLKHRLHQSEAHEILVQDIWKLTENELEITRTNTFELGSITISNQEETAEIVKLGMFKLFFKTSHGQRGFAKFDNQKWTMQVLDNQELIVAIDNIIAQVRQQKGSALISLPKELL